MARKINNSKPLPDRVQQSEATDNGHDGLQILAHLIARHHMSKHAEDGSTPPNSNQGMSPSLEDLSKARKGRSRSSTKQNKQ